MPTLDTDDAFIALLIAAMDVSGHAFNVCTSTRDPRLYEIEKLAELRRAMAETWRGPSSLVAWPFIGFGARDHFIGLGIQCRNNPVVPWRLHHGQLRHPKTPLIRNWFAKCPRFHVNVIPTYASWLSLVERRFALSTKEIRRGVFRSVPQLKAATQAFTDAHQKNPKPFVWTKTAGAILGSIARFAERTADARAAQLLSQTIGTGH